MIRSTTIHFLIVTVLVAVGLNSGRGAEPVALAPELTSVFGPQAGDWKSTPEKYVPWQAVSVARKASLAAPSECEVTYRIKTTGGVGIYFACADRPDKMQQTLGFSASLAAASPYMSYATTVVGGKTPPPAASGSLYLVPVSERSLAWSEEMRRAIEAQIAAVPKTEDQLFTLRCTVENDRFKCWINGRFVNETALTPGEDRSSIIRIDASAGAEIVSVRVGPKPASPAAFETLCIAGFMNSAALAGEKVDHASLPGAKSNSDGSVPLVDGVPFEFPKPAPGGNDHMDVSSSWTRFGAIPGYIAANSGSFGGRWISADRTDPSRLCLYVPQGRYKALHLMAVADDRPDSVPIVSAQFYRPDAGHPINFSGTVPNLKGEGGSGEPVTIKLANGKKAKLYHVVIPLDPDAFSWFTDLPRIGLEITKQVQFYRGYPDPLEYSWHGAGLPSSVQIYAMTLERVGVDVEITPDHFGHVWTAPEKPSYTMELRNRTGAATTAKLVISTKSYDGKDTTRQTKEAALPADGSPVKVAFTLNPTRYGLQDLMVECKAGGDSATFKRNFAYLHQDTREQAVWEDGRGPIFGYWPWGGGHTTPTSDKEITVMAAAGAETSTANYSQSPPEIQALALKHHFIAESAFSGGVMYYNGFYEWYASAPKFDPAKPEESGAALVKVMKTVEAKPGPISRPTYVPFFAEPQLGNITTGIWPSHYGEDYKLNDAEQKAFDSMLAKYLAGARAIRKEWPKLKLLMPYGDPMNTVAFLKLSPESRDLIDGCALDMPGFERLPEQQVNQVVLNRLYPILKDIKEYKKDPYLMLIEGTCISSKDIDTQDVGQADISTRDFLVLMGYGVYRFESSNAPFDCANYWGENHYGAGWCSRLPLAMPKLAYVNYATLSRHVNRSNFTKYVTTGSDSTYCEQFKHYKTGKLVHVLWTIRGTRPVNIKVAPGTTLEIYDGNDNVTALNEKNGVVTFTIDQSPQYLEGLTGDPEITLGESDHSDSLPVRQPGFFAKLGGAKAAGESKKLSGFGDGSWKLVEKDDAEYTKNKPQQIERFPGKMTAAVVDAPKEQGGKALAIHLEKQAKDRGVMPFFTTLEPREPITIAGKARHLGLWVHAASDWGRVVYVVRDAKGEKWISVGTKEEWNNDDIHCWSSFCFDGWRYLKFELPSSAPYDSYREYGTSWWGSYGGDGVVDLPLKLEKVIVERRPKVIYGNDLVEAKTDDVLLGDLNAEYASADDDSDEAVRLSKVRMPVPKEAPALGNPIAELAAAGVGAPTKVLGVKDPEHEYDGTRCIVIFEPVVGAKGYDVWVSPYADGRGAMQLAKAWTESGKLITGLRPDTEFYLFVVYTDKDGKASKPSAPLEFKLTDRFGYK